MAKQPPPKKPGAGSRDVTLTQLRAVKKSIAALEARIAALEQAPRPPAVPPPFDHPTLPELE